MERRSTKAIHRGREVTIRRKEAMRKKVEAETEGIVRKEMSMLRESILKEGILIDTSIVMMPKRKNHKAKDLISVLIPTKYQQDMLRKT